MATCMQWQIVSPEVSGHDKWIWQDRAEGCCHFIPRVVDLVVKGVRDAAGTLLSILSIFILSSFCFFLRLGKIYVANSW